jgi:hypothetical protein
MQFTSLATDAFNGTDGTVLGSTWDSGYTGYQEARYNTNQCAAQDPNDTSNDNTLILETYNDISWPNNQYCQLTLSTFPTCNMAGVVLRAAAPPTVTYYYLTTGNFNSGGTGPITIGKYVSGSHTELADDTVAVWTDGTILKGAVLGTSLALYKDGTEVLTATDSAISAGRGGLTMLYFTNCSGQSGLSLKVDNWVGGETSADEADTIIHRLMLLGVGR